MVRKTGDGLAPLAAFRQARGLGAREVREFGDERSRPLGANRLPGRRVFASDLRLDRMERGDTREDRLGDGRARFRRGGDDFAPAMAPTPGEPRRGAAFAPGSRQPMVASLSIDLKDAVEPFENPFGALSAAPRRVMTDNDGWIGAAVSAIVARDSPRIACLRPASAGIERRDVSRGAPGERGRDRFPCSNLGLIVVTP
jgi:hypothetical protein